MIAKLVILLEKEIEAVGKTQVAERAGISRSTLDQVLNGTTSPRLSWIESVAEKLGYDMEIEFFKLENA